MKKLPHKIDTDDLLKALESTDDSHETLHYDNDVPLFLSKFKLDAGTFKVRCSQLYKLYKVYSKYPLSIDVFANNAKLFIPKDKNYYNINISPIKLMKLLSPVKSKNTRSSSFIKKRYETFLLKKDIKKGSKWIESFMFFEVYRFYTIDNKSASIGYEHFVSISKLYFENKRIGSSKGIWFKLDPSILNELSEEHQQRVRNGRKKEKNR